MCSHASNARTSYVMHQGRIHHGGAQRRMTYDAYATEGSSFCVVPLTHASMSALGACVPMCQMHNRISSLRGVCAICHTSLSALSSCVPMHQTRASSMAYAPRVYGAYAMEQARSRGGTLLPLYVIYHVPRALISLCL